MDKTLASFAALALLTTPALAQRAGDRAVTVAHADLDLSTAKGRKTLDRRIAAATEQVCGSYAGLREDEERAVTRCRAEAARQVARVRTGREAVRFAKR